MFSNLDTGEWFIIGICGFLVIWYFAASIYNRNRGLTIFRWLRKGMGSLGDDIKSEWLGSSATGVRMSIVHPQSPFYQIEATYLLETREILPYWIYTHLRGRRDGMTILANLRKSPALEIDHVSELPTLSHNPSTFNKKNTEEANASNANDTTIPGEKTELDQVETFIQLLQQNPQLIRAFSLKKKKPHIKLSVGIEISNRIPAETFFKGFARWVDEMHRYE